MYRIYYLLIIALIVADQGVKYFIRMNMVPGESVPLIENALHITYVRNSGGAFSVLQGQALLLIIVPAILMAAIIVYIFIQRKNNNPALMISLSMICGGGAGNFTDRVRFGSVVDFIDFRFFPVFNVADIYVTCGCGILIFYAIAFERNEKLKLRSREL